MIYGILSVILALGSIGAFILKVINENQSLKAQAALQKDVQATKEWSDKIEAADAKIKESEIDYEKAKAKFNTDNSGTPPSGAV